MLPVLKAEAVRELRVNKITQLEREYSDLGGDAYKLATIAHAFQCNSNHTDGCGWEYDTGNWTSFARVIYLCWAEVLLNLVTYEQAKALLINGLLETARR